MINWKLFNRRMAKLAIVMTDANNALRKASNPVVSDVETVRSNLKSYDKASKAANKVCEECGVDFSTLLTITENNYNDTMRNIHMSISTVDRIIESCVMSEEADNESEVN